MAAKARNSIAGRVDEDQFLWWNPWNLARQGFGSSSSGDVHCISFFCNGRSKWPRNPTRTKSCTGFGKTATCLFSSRSTRLGTHWNSRAILKAKKLARDRTCQSYSVCRNPGIEERLASTDWKSVRKRTDWKWQVSGYNCQLVSFEAVDQCVQLD